MILSGRADIKSILINKDNLKVIYPIMSLTNGNTFGDVNYMKGSNKDT